MSAMKRAHDDETPDVATKRVHADAAPVEHVLAQLVVPTYWLGLDDMIKREVVERLDDFTRVSWSLVSRATWAERDVIASLHARLRYCAVLEQVKRLLYNHVPRERVAFMALYHGCSTSLYAFDVINRMVHAIRDGNKTEFLYLRYPEARGDLDVYLSYASAPDTEMYLLHRFINGERP